MSKKQQIKESLDSFIEKNADSYNGIIPLKELEYSFNDVTYIYESPYYTNLYEDKVSWFHLKEEHLMLRVRDLSKDERKKLVYHMHGNSQVVYVY